MIQDNKNILENNTLLNDNDNGSLNENACLEAIPYEQALQQNGWGELKPITAALLPVEPFDLVQVPLDLSHYIYDVADRQQSPIDFVAVSALCGLAAVIGNGVRIAPKQQDDWIVVPNLWGAIVGKPSALKSPAMQAALEPVYTLQEEWYEEWKKKKKQQRMEERFEELSKQEKEKQAKKALKKGDIETTRALLSETLSEDHTDDECLSRFIVNDVTVEKLGELLEENPRGLLMVRDELSGFLTDMERKEYQTDRAFYLTAFNGNTSYNYDRIGRGTIFIPNATVSIIGGIQPSRIIPLVQTLLSGKGDDGLIQRFQMLVWPDDNQERKWTDRYPNLEAKKNYEEIFRFFRDKPLGSPEHPLVMRFAPKAQEMFRVWWENFQKTIKENNLSESLQAHLLKMPKTIASLALIFELVEGGRFEVTLPSLHMALRWEKYLLSHVKRLYAAADSLATEGAKLIVERCDHLPDVFTLRDIHQRSWIGLKDKEAMKQALELLCRSNHIRQIAVENSSQGGRPTIRYEWHPFVKNNSIKQ